MSRWHANGSFCFFFLLARDAFDKVRTRGKERGRDDEIFDDGGEVRRFGKRQRRAVAQREDRAKRGDQDQDKT